ncbi:MAG: Tad domain-containing protein [Terracidiphilus sp.]
MLKETSGQAIYIVVAGLTAVIGLSGIAVDLGHGYYAHQLLQTSTNAVALAGASALPNTTAASNYVTSYSSATGDKNASPLLTNVQATPTFLCLNTVVKMGIPCAASSGSTSGNFNAVRVVQTGKVPLWFGGMFGLSNYNITTVSTAVMSGGSNSPWNIAIILDTTASMASSDSGLQCSGTQISCALKGVQYLLQDLDPCALSTTCTSSVPAVDSVSLFVFPAVTTATVANDYDCTSSNPTSVPYTFPSNTGTGLTETMSSTTGTYQIIPFTNTYRVSDATTSLNTSVNIVKAAGGKSGCSGIGAPGGEGTYYAQVIYAAQAALVAQQTANTGSQNAMIILSDGDATACATSANTSAGGCSTSAQLVATTGALNGTTQTGYTSVSKISYTYPSALGECGQAVQAAHDAATNTAYNNSGSFTRVFTVGYGAEPSGGCTTDKTYSATITGGGGSWAAGKQPCAAIAAMASDSAYFFSDNGAGCSSPNGVNFTKLTQIFTAIAANLTTPRLVPNSTT